MGGGWGFHNYFTFLWNYRMRFSPQIFVENPQQQDNRIGGLLKEKVQNLEHRELFNPTLTSDSGFYRINKSHGKPFTMSIINDFSSLLLFLLKELGSLFWVQGKPHKKHVFFQLRENCNWKKLPPKMIVFSPERLLAKWHTFFCWDFVSNTNVLTIPFYFFVPDSTICMHPSLHVCSIVCLNAATSASMINANTPRCLLVWVCELHRSSTSPPPPWDDFPFSNRRFLSLLFEKNEGMIK